MKNLKKLFKDESGATAIEYGLIAALIALAILGAASQMGSNVNDTFGKVDAALVAANDGSGGTGGTKSGGGGSGGPSDTGSGSTDTTD